MTIQEAFNFLEGLKNKTISKSEIKIYENFLNLLIKLKDREFSQGEIESIETKLDSLNLESNLGSRKKVFAKLLKEFKNYLKEKHSLISKGYYTNIGITYGAAFGIVAGVIIGERFEKSLGLALGIGIGMLIGLFVGRSKVAKVNIKNRML